MTELRIGDQTIRYDRQATAAVYETIEFGCPEKCACGFCRNFAGQRDLAYPASFKALLKQLGIDPNKEGEVYEEGPVEDGFHLYGGWLYLIGELDVAGDSCSVAPDCESFSFWFPRHLPGSVPFRNGPVLAVEFSTLVRWVLPQNPDSFRTKWGRRPTALNRDRCELAA